MAMPQAIQRAVEQAEVLQAQIYPENPAPTEPVEQTVEVETAPDAQPTNVVELQRPAEPAPVETPKPADVSEDVSYWKQKFSSLQGKFNAEVPQLHQQLREQSQRLSKVLEQLQSQTDAPPASDARDSQDAEDFGPPMTEMVDRRAEAIARKVVSQVVAQELAALRKEFGTMQESVGAVTERVAMTESEKFWAGVMTLVPDWKQIDDSPEWRAWLDTTPEFAEDTYRDLATKAIYKGDAQKIANLVKLFRGPAPQAPVAPPAVNPELLRQVAPSTSRASAPAPQAGKVWSAAEYSAAMDVRNVQRFGQAEADRLEAEATQAVAEGRVRW